MKQPMTPENGDFERGDRKHGRGRRRFDRERSDFSLESFAEGYGAPMPPGARKRSRQTDQTDQ